MDFQDNLADLQRTIEAFEQAVEQSQPGDPNLPTYLTNLGSALMRRYERAGDLADLDKTIEAWEQAWSLLQTTFAASPVTYKIGQQREWAPLSARLVSAYLKQALVSPVEASTARRRALEVAEGSKSRLLTELIGRADLPAPSGILPQLVERERQLLAELTALDTAALTAQGSPITSIEEANSLVRLQQRQERLQELEDLWTQMAQAGDEAADYVALRRGTPLTWQDLAHLAAELGSETALISFFITEERALLFIVRAGWEEPIVVETDFGESARFDTLQRLFREVHTSRGSRRRGETWHRQLKGLLEKARTHLDGVKRTVFAPYSDGHLIPWSVVAERAGWHGSDQQALPLVILPALGLLLQLRKRPSHRDGSVLVVGNPLGDLNYAEEEADEVAATLKAKSLLGPQATEAEVVARMSDAIVVHLATHAYFNPDSPLDSGVLLAGGGVLTAREAMNQRLHADLLVLSACETGMAGSLGGDELTGLAQAFLQAGAQSLIVSLWSVDDSSTASFMRAFYSAYRAEVDNGIDKARALSQAMTHVREQEEWQHPYYWGAFVLMGDW